MNDRVVFLGSGEFGVPTLRALQASGRVELVVSQPDRPAGRGRRLAGTPISECAVELGLPLIRPEDVNTESVVEQIRSAGAATFVVIAFGQKLKPPILHDLFAINLHGSLLPRHRGAAPVQWSIMSGDEMAGLSVIGLAQRMDAGVVYGTWATPIGELETAGELHDRLAAEGPRLMMQVLQSKDRGLIPREQDEASATRAPKLNRADATVDCGQSAFMVQRRIHGLSPKPGCSIRLDGRVLKVLRTGRSDEAPSGEPGVVRNDGSIGCLSGTITPIEVQPPNSGVMSWQAYRNGHRVEAGMKCEPCVSVEA